MSRHSASLKSLGRSRVVRQCFRSLEWNVWPLGIRWTIDKTEFDELSAMKKDSAPGPDVFPYGAYKSSGKLGRNSCLMLTDLCWKKVLFQNISMKKELSSSSRHLTPMTMEGCWITRRVTPTDAVQLRMQDTPSCNLSRAPLEHPEMDTLFAEMYLLQTDDGHHF